MLPWAILGVPLVAGLHVDGMREVMDAAGTEALEAALGTGSKIVPMFGQEGIDNLPPERYSAALLDPVLAGRPLEDTKVAILQDWLEGPQRRGRGDEWPGRPRRGETGAEAPVNQMLVERSRRIESGELKPGLEKANLMTSALAK